MKRLIPIFCISIALIFLMSSVGVALLPAEHDCCMRKDCAVCALISVIERLMRNLLPTVAIVAVFGLFLQTDRAAHRVPGYLRTASETPVQLMDKLSN